MQEQCRIISLEEYKKLKELEEALETHVESERMLVGLVDTKQAVIESLSKKLAIAVEALKFYSDEFGYDYELDDPFVYVFNEGKCLLDSGDKAVEALKKIEEL